MSTNKPSPAPAGPDIRDIIFRPVAGRLYTADIIVEQAGILAGVRHLETWLNEQGITARVQAADGAAVAPGAVIARLTGSAKEIAVAEEFVIGFLAKPSGIASAARRAVDLAGPDIAIVCGAWKKMPHAIKNVVREAVICGGAACRIADQPFLYLDKNFVRMLGGIAATLQAVADITDRLKVIQLKGESGDIAADALAAARGGADIIMIDTGRVADAEQAHAALAAAGCRHRVRIAFAKGIRLEAISEIKGKGIDILDIGVSIIDAPLLDMKLEVVNGG